LIILKQMRYIFILLIIQAFVFQIQAQEVSATASLDSTLILIGGQIDMKMEISQPADLVLNFPQFNDTITKNIEIVDKGYPDTARLDNNRLLISQLYRITSFDTGLHYIPPYEIEFEINNLKQNIKSNPLSLMVVNPYQDVNPENGIYDIKGVKDAPFKLNEIINYIYIALGAFVLIGLLIWLYLYYRGKQKEEGSKFINVKPNEPPHIIAIRELDKIKEQKLWEKDRIKEFYTLVSNTIREYIENRYNINALEQTSDEMLTEMKSKIQLDNEVMSKLTQMLQLSDLVKFAKYKPLPDENGLSLLNAYFFVEKTKETIQKSIDEIKASGIDEDKDSL